MKKNSTKTIRSFFACISNHDLPSLYYFTEADTSKAPTVKELKNKYSVNRVMTIAVIISISAVLAAMAYLYAQPGLILLNVSSAEDMMKLIALNIVVMGLLLIPLFPIVRTYYRGKIGRLAQKIWTVDRLVFLSIHAKEMRAHLEEYKENLSYAGFAYLLFEYGKILAILPTEQLRTTYAEVTILYWTLAAEACNFPKALDRKMMNEAVEAWGPHADMLKSLKPDLYDVYMDIVHIHLAEVAKTETAFPNTQLEMEI